MYNFFQHVLKNVFGIFAPVLQQIPVALSTPVANSNVQSFLVSCFLLNNTFIESRDAVYSDRFCDNAKLIKFLRQKVFLEGKDLKIPNSA